jgi:peptidoglycan hydrolase-like protein with peptidoglycan-binding domain
MPVQVIRYRKIVSTGLNPQEVRFAESGAMGHRVSFDISTEHMNNYFKWIRAKDELSPTGHFFNVPSLVTDSLGNPIPTFYGSVLKALGTKYSDQDGVATGLNFSSSALEQAADSKRDPSIRNVNTLGVPTETHYSANDLLMAYILYKCYGSSSVDTSDLIYNIEDAYGLLKNEVLAGNILLSLSGEEMLAQQAVLPLVPVSNQRPGTNKGAVDAMFRNLLSLDPLRYFDASGVQVKGLFEVSVDVDASGSWQFMDGDKVEIPVTFVFRSPVSVLSVQDTIRNPSSSTPEKPETTFITGEAADFNTSGPTAAAMANTFRIRLQLNCVSFNSGGGIVPPSTLLALQSVANVAFPTSGKAYYVGKTIVQQKVSEFFTGGNGYKTYSTYSILPAGLYLAPNGILYGTPLATANNITYTIIATDALGNSASVNITFAVILPLALSSPVPLLQWYPSALRTTPGELHPTENTFDLSGLVVGGFGELTWTTPTIPGANAWPAPTGLITLGANNLDYGGLLTVDTAMLTILTSGIEDLSYNVVVTDALANSLNILVFMTFDKTLPLSLTVTHPPSSPDSDWLMIANQPFLSPYSDNPFDFVISGGDGPFTVSVSGNTLGSSFNPASGLMTGAATYAGGPSKIIFTLKDSLGATVTQDYNLSVAPELIVQPAVNQTVSKATGSATVEFKLVNVYGGYLASGSPEIDTTDSATAAAVLALGTPTIDPLTNKLVITRASITTGAVGNSYVLKVKVAANTLITNTFKVSSNSCTISIVA